MISMVVRKSKILFIDPYDSFSNNIVSLLETLLDVEVTKIFHDAKVPQLALFLKSFAAVVAGPGPGTAENPKHVGLTQKIWRLPDRDLIPVLGICLGFQSLVHEFGGRIARLPFPRHGVRTTVTSNEASIFRGLAKTQAVQYHSLYATIGHGNPEARQTAQNWWSVDTNSELEPLAWDFDRGWELEAAGASASNPEGILMAVKHTRKPFHGIQFHPESICSDEGVQLVVRNWWSEVQAWLALNRLREAPWSPPWNAPPLAYPVISASSPICDDFDSAPSTPMTSRSASPASSLSSTLSSKSEHRDRRSHAYIQNFLSLAADDLTIPAIADALDLGNQQCIILDSEAYQDPKLGRFSIVGLIDAETTTLKYSAGSSNIETECNDRIESATLHHGGVFGFLKSFLLSNSVSDGHSDSPFWGGLLGYITYDACLETIGIASKPTLGRPSMCFAHIERSIVIDYFKNLVYIQSTKVNDQAWSLKTHKLLSDLSRRNQMRFDGQLEMDLPRPSSVRVTSEAAYQSKVSTCQDEIKAGNSYELCLTNQVSIQVPKSLSPWGLYKRQRRLNPAPFGAYVRLRSLSLLSTSPERFLRWSRPTVSRASSYCTSVCQFRPIKGTVRKTRPDGSRVSRAEAEAILATNKEQAENLMIVDLIRHDLHGVARSGHVSVPQLMTVEEYASVFQLVSVIEGTIRVRQPHDASRAHEALGALDCGKATHGIDVLAASLPPGSMTGAPKKRSCEILQEIEDHEPRSVYSGVLGYMCAGGGGDFSVVIRSAFRWDDAGDANHDEWKIGAGGAVTGLSTPEGEYEEMCTKLASVMGVFRERP